VTFEILREVLLALTAAGGGGLLYRWLLLKSELRKRFAEARSIDADTAAKLATSALEQVQFYLSRVENLERQVDHLRRLYDTEREARLRVESELRVLQLTINGGSAEGGVDNHDGE
jgi:hypothetical protein